MSFQKTAKGDRVCLMLTGNSLVGGAATWNAQEPISVDHECKWLLWFRVHSTCGDARMNNLSRLSTDMHKMCPGRLCPSCSYRLNFGKVQELSQNDKRIFHSRLHVFAHTKCFLFCNNINICCYFFLSENVFGTVQNCLIFSIFWLGGMSVKTNFDGNYLGNRKRHGQIKLVSCWEETN